jgi:hypothetical protein
MDQLDRDNADPEVITWQHVRAAGYCLHRGARQWCAANGVSFRALMTVGIPIADVEKLDDAMARRVIEVARGR